MMKGMSIQLPIHRIALHISTSTFLCVKSFLPFLKFLRKVKYCLNFDIQVFISIVKFVELNQYSIFITKICNPIAPHTNDQIFKIG